MASKEATRKQRIKLRKSRRSVLTVPPGGQVVITGKPIDGKPGVLVEYPDGSTVRHETLTRDRPSG